MRNLGVFALWASMLLWLYGGGQIGFYREYYTIEKMDEILGIAYEERVPAFLPGIETLAGGFMIFALAILAAALWERRIERTLRNT
ncbi:hypothetical protein [Pelagicoccus sp. SDUM812003]|uniref:hypothetical protein n=1 Tax=Pelagicoccus sp. SDUM812003 TaxID=3041267 RepID=UPI0028108598|nr:hypothetical protein [Pelagicoccus sp. SDUM812003]MDQ8203823.1 hypothetical protein [Pelagicoccus sp. SDUM812003]